jgi:hypothetical protein
MSGALAKLRAILEAGGKEARAIERLIGETFYDAADTVPDMFRRGRRFARGDENLGKQFGVEIRRPDSYSAEIYALNSPAKGHAEMSYITQPGPSDSFRFPYARPRVEFDTTLLANRLNNFGDAFGSGGGSGRGVYGAMFGSLLEDPDLVNVTSSLSSRNEHRRNFNQAAALLREPRLSRQIAVDPYQLLGPAAESGPELFMRRAAPDQVGALQGAGALQTLARLEKTYSKESRDSALSGPLRSLYEDLIPRIEDPAAFKTGAGLLRKSEAEPRFYDTVGEAALRRAALVSDIVEGRPNARRHLFQGLEYRSGGRV